MKYREVVFICILYKGGKRMKTSIHVVAREYAKEFYNYVVKININTTNENLYKLFSYCMCEILDIESAEYNLEIRKYNIRCVKNLRKIKCNRLEIENLSLEERVDLLECSKIYLTVILQGYKKLS